MLGLFLLLLINFGISWFNAVSVGKSWIEIKCSNNKWLKLISWCGAIMSGAGFSWVYIAVLGLITQAAGLLPPKYVQVVFEMGYLAVIFPILGSGLALTIQSWAHFWRERSFGSGAVAGWNTFAQMYNTYEAISLIPEVINHLGGVIAGEDEDDEDSGPLLAIAIMIVVFAILAGALTTAAIIRKTVRDHASDVIVQQALEK